MKNKSSENRERQDVIGRILDNPDLVKTKKESIFDKHIDMQTVDAVPVEELNEKVKDEKYKYATKSTSSSEERYPD